MEMVEIKNSSNIAAAGWEKGELVVEFKGGSKYRYLGVPEQLFTNMLNADSIGKYFSAEIKPNYKVEEVPTPKVDTLEEKCAGLRGEIEDIKKRVFILIEDSAFNGEQTHKYQFNEMRANIILSYRGLEDARMRLGKVMQHIQGGVSILDK